ncbi:MAG: DUF3800 domain-containing protein [Treponema sp.]|jgi:hypothetical protein|nr:DUF3800 domain-containing protein [Treponema sp.]
MKMKSSNYLVFVDEAGDHTIAPRYLEFPLLVLAFVIISKDEYCDKLLPQFTRLKLKYFSDVSTIFHERDIRKRKNDFRILMVPDVREHFLSDMNLLMERINYNIVSAVIDKRKIQNNTENPALYEMAVKQGIKLVRKFLINIGDINQTTLTFESRGKTEDGKLREYLSCEEETFKFVLHKKSADGLGLQFADMIARPIGIHILNPHQKNRAWNIIKGKLFEVPTLLP